MKKLLLLILTVALSLSVLVSCDKIDGFIDSVTGNNQEEGYLYHEFSISEKKLFTNSVGALIPFLPTDEYYIVGSNGGDDYSEGINYYTVGNTEDEFEKYRASLTGYEMTDSYADDNGDVWYCYTDGKRDLKISYYLYDGQYYTDIYVSLCALDSSGNENQGGENQSGYIYTDFTDEEKALLQEYFGELVPFVPNDEYYLEEYTYDYEDGECEVGLNFYTFGNTQSDFNAYKTLFSAYSYDGSDVDDYGDTWYYYTTAKETYIDISFYSTDDGNVIDVYAYYLTDSSSGDNTGGSSSDSEYDILTNEGAGLPTDADGVYDVDFTKADRVKDVSDQGYYLDGCPTVGSPGVLVIPVEFKDVTASSKGYSIDTIANAFAKDGDADYYSVYDYYFISSYGKLALDITVLDSWFCPKYESSYYENATIDYYGEDISAGEQLIIDEALEYLEGIMDLTQFDSDGNGIIDSIVLINTLDIDQETDFYWAFRYWNTYTDDEGYYYEYDGVSANDYLWMSCGFFHESYSEDGEISYTDKSVLNTYTAIHEFGHILGADDYYDTAYVSEPMGGCDIMDSMMGDHNAFTKFNLGWVTTSRLVVTDGSITLTLEDFSKNGDTVIIANNWDETLGAYQEYYIVAYYTQSGLNGGDYGYFSRDGVVVYHVNASLYADDSYDEIYYDIYNNNTDPSDSYGTENNLIEYVLTDEEHYTYVAGDSLSAVTDDLGNDLCYTFTVDSLTDAAATITFTKG